MKRAGSRSGVGSGAGSVTQWYFKELSQGGTKLLTCQVNTVVGKSADQDPFHCVTDPEFLLTIYRCGTCKQSYDLD